MKREAWTWLRKMLHWSPVERLTALEALATVAEVKQLRSALREIAAHCACTCDEIWPSRGMHQPNECKSYLIEYIDAALKPKRAVKR